MPVKLTDKVYNEGGSPVQGAAAQAILTNGTTTSVISTDLTDTKGIWAFDSSIAGHQADLPDPGAGQWYDVRINAGMQYRLRYGAIKAMMSMVYLAQSIVLGAAQLFDASLAAMRIPARTSDPTPVGPGQIVFRTDQKNLKVSDGTSWYSMGGQSVTVSAAGTYVVPGGIDMVFVTVTGVTVQLPAAPTAVAPVTVSPNFSLTTTVTAASGGVYGGSVNPNTGAIVNGQIFSSASGMDSITFRSDGANWRAV